MLLASVAIQDAVLSYDKLYDYIVPEGLIKNAQAGMRVLVPFGRNNKIQTGWIIKLWDGEGKKLKKIHQIVDETPLLSDEMLKLAQWIKNRYFCTWGDAIRIMVPSGVNLKRLVKLYPAKALKDWASIDQFLKNSDLALTEEQDQILRKIFEKPKGIYEKDLNSGPESEESIKKLVNLGLVEKEELFDQKVNEKTVKAVKPAISKEEFNAIVDEGKLRSIYPVRVMDVLYTEEFCTLQDLLLIPGVSHSTIKSMEKKGWVSYFELEVERNPFETLEPDKSDPPVLTSEQQHIIDSVLPCLDENKLNEVLIHGITGSGKTEVYLRLIDAAIKRGKSSIVLVPEISLTPQIISRFTGRFGSRVAIQHSRLSQGERYDQWRKIKAGEVDVVIGARSAVFAPLSNIGIIIVDEEHELSYKSENMPRYDARHVARARCNINGALLVLSSATPSVETYYRSQKGKIGLYTLKKRPNALPLPKVEIVDLRDEHKAGNHGIISRRLEEELVKNKMNGEQSIVFINRRGYASFIFCMDCGFVQRCPNCSVSLTVHAHDRQAICHYCGYAQPIPVKCPQCASGNIKPFGVGTQKVEEELLKHPAGFSVLRMDLDTTSGKQGHQKLLDAFKNKEADILIGTQMVAKGHDFSNVTLVGILAADASLFLGDYRSSERTFQLITQASGRAGRGDKPGRVILQAYNVDDYAIQTAVAQNYEEFYQKEIALRQKMIYPPFCHIGLVMVSGENPEHARISIERLKGQIMSIYNNEPGFLCSDIMPSPVFVIRNRARWRFIIKMASINELVKLVNYASSVFEKLKIKSTDLTVDIDPPNML
ncbi:MAG: primosomal protein N' [Clostridiaceae bacterium]|nr:primosomal protein N' [Clostridiaceae bacterium]